MALPSSSGIQMLYAVFLHLIGARPGWWWRQNCWSNRPMFLALACRYSLIHDKILISKSNNKLSFSMILPSCKNDSHRSSAQPPRSGFVLFAKNRAGKLKCGSMWCVIWRCACDTDSMNIWSRVQAACGYCFCPCRCSSSSITRGWGNYRYPQCKYNSYSQPPRRYCFSANLIGYSTRILLAWRMLNQFVRAHFSILRKKNCGEKDIRLIWILSIEQMNSIEFHRDSGSLNIVFLRLTEVHLSINQFGWSFRWFRRSMAYCKRCLGRNEHENITQILFQCESNGDITNINYVLFVCELRL